MLGILERVRRLVRSTIPLGVSMAAVSGAWVAATAHGCLSIRLLLGQRAAHRTLAGPWPWHVSIATMASLTWTVLVRLATHPVYSCG